MMMDRRGSSHSVNSAHSHHSQTSSHSSQTPRSTPAIADSEETVSYVHRRRQSYTETMKEKSLGSRFLKVVPHFPSLWPFFSILLVSTPRTSLPLSPPLLLLRATTSLDLQPGSFPAMPLSHMTSNPGYLYFLLLTFVSNQSSAPQTLTHQHLCCSGQRPRHTSGNTGSCMRKV